MHLALKHLQALGEILAHAAQDARINSDTGQFHGTDHRHQWPLDPLIDIGHPVRRQTRFQDAVQAQGCFGILGGIAGSGRDIDLIEGDLFLALADHALEFHHLMIEIEQREVVEGMAVLATVEHIGQQHGVIDRGHVDALPFQQLPVIFEIMPDLKDRRVFKHRFQRGNDVGHGQLPDIVAILLLKQVLHLFMLQRDIGTAGGLGRQTDTDQLGGRGMQAVGFGINREEAAVIGIGDNRLQRCHLADRGEAALADRRQLFRFCSRSRSDGLCRALCWRFLNRWQIIDTAIGQPLNHPCGQGFEVLFAQKTAQLFSRWLIGNQAVERLRYRCVLVEGHQLHRDTRQIGKLDQVLTPLVLFDLTGPCQQGFEIAIFLNQQGSGLDANARHARNIVGTVTGQCLYIDHPFWLNAELLEHLFRAGALVLHGVEQADPVIDQLHQVLVGGDDNHFLIPLTRLSGIGGDQVVSLVALKLDRRQSKCPHGIADQAELRAQVFRRCLAVRLVLGIDFVAEGVGFGVKDNADIMRVEIGQQLQQHVAEAIDRVHLRAIGTVHRRQGVIGTEDKARSIDEIERFGWIVFGRIGHA